MSIICNSSCVPYVTNNDITKAIIESYKCVNNSSKCSNTVSPPAFPVSITIDNSKAPNTIYHISIGPVEGINNLNYDLIIDKNGAGTLGNVPEGVSISFPLGQDGVQSCGNPNSAVTKATLTFPNNSLYPFGSTSEMPFQVNDSYTINVLSCCNTKSVDVIFERPLYMAMVTECNTPDCASPCANVKVPLLFINGQTTINGSDVADMLFTIYDKYSYEEECPLPKNLVCSVDYVDKIDLVKTVLRVCSAKMVSVVRGNLPTLYCKADFIWTTLKPTQYLTTFYERLIKYGMLKFILSRLLYGDFNINYLLGKYNDKFLANLGRSRFCAFIQNFNDCQSDIYGYNKYFKKEIKCNETPEIKHKETEEKQPTKITKKSKNKEIKTHKKDDLSFGDDW